MIASHRRPFAFVPITTLLLSAVFVGLPSEARATATAAAQESPQGSAIKALEARLAELELLRRTEGPAFVLAELAKEKEALERATEAQINAQGLTPNSARYKALQRELDVSLEVLTELEQRVKASQIAPVTDPTRESVEESAQRAHVLETVRFALKIGDLDKLRQLGAAIEDVLVELALDTTHPVALLDMDVKLLAWLADLSPARAIDVALELVSRPGNGWAAAVYTSLDLRANQLRKVGPLRLASGAPAPAPFELALRLLGSDEVPAETRAAIAVPFLAAGIDDPRLLEASERVASDMQFTSSFRVPELEWWHTRLLASDTTEQRVAGTRGRLGYADVDDFGLLERLLHDAAPEVRALVAKHLPSVLPAKVLPTSEYRVLWILALADFDPVVRGTAYVALNKRVGEGGTLPLTVPATVDLLLALEGPSEARPAAPFFESAGPRNLIDALPAVATTYEELGAAYGRLLDSRRVDVADRVLSVLSTTPSDVCAATVVHFGEPSPEVSTRFAQMFSDYRKLHGATPAACLRAFTRIVQHPHAPGALVWYTADALRDKSSDLSLDALSPEDASEVLQRSGRAAPELVGRFLQLTQWERCRGPLATSAADPSRSLMARALALLALERAQPSNPASVAALTEMISAAIGDEREQGEAARLVRWASIALDSDPKALSAALNNLLASTEVPTEAFDGVVWTERHAEALALEELSALFDALEHRVAGGHSGQVPLQGFAGAALAVMQREPSLVRKALVLGWSEHFIPGAATVALRSTDMELAAALRGRFLAKLDSAIHNHEITPLIAALIHLEGPNAAADHVAERAATLGKPKLVTIATELLESTAKLREVGARLASTSSSASRDAAVTDVVALLDAPDEAVRVEAIRGLATLGAVEHLPRLIRIVGKGSPAERAAARAALDSLHQRAAKEAQQAAQVQVPPEQARDGETPR